MGLWSEIKGAFGFGDVTKSVALTDANIAELFGAPVTVSGAAISPASALRVPAVNSAIALISGAIGSLPAKAFSTKSGIGGKRAAKDHPAYKLVHDWANEWTSASKLRKKLTIDALCYGSGFAYTNRNAVGEPVEFIRFDPQSITVKTDQATGEPVYSQRLSNGRERVFGYQDMLHISAPLGMSPIKAGREAIGLASVLERHAAQLFANGARPSLVFENEGSAPEGERGATVIKRIKDAYAAWRANGGPMVLDSGWKANQHTFTSTDAQFLENRRFQTEEIARVFRIPPHLLFDLSRATWSNAEEMFQSFLTLTLRSWLDEWEAAYARVLLTPEERDAGYYIEFVIDDLLTANAATRVTVQRQLRAMGAITANEVRAQLNMPAMEGGDVLASPFTTPAPAMTPAAPKPRSESSE